MLWNLLLMLLFVVAAVISGLALLSGSGLPHSHRRPH
jgi:hypothetical protein